MHEFDRLLFEATGLEIPRPEGLRELQAATPKPGSPMEDAQNVEKNRVDLTGRVGTLPRFRTSQKGTRIAEFHLAQHHDDNSTTWHTVLAFGPRAVKLEVDQQLKKGDLVDVVGYRHVRDVRKKDGSTKSVEEVYAVLIKQR